MTNDTRAAFEAWAKTQPAIQAGCYGDPFKPDFDDGTYWFPRVQSAWLAYAASRRAALEEALRECEEVADHWDAMHNTQASMAADQCVVAIRALADEGVKS